MQEVSENYVEPVVFADEDLRPAPKAYGAISFGCGLYEDDDLSTAASELEDFLADTCGSLPSGRQERRSSTSYSKLLDVVTRVVDKMGLDWEANVAQAQSQSNLDDRFLTSRASAQPRNPLPFFPDLHQEVSKSWKQPFSARITDAFRQLIPAQAQGNKATSDIDSVLTLIVFTPPTGCPARRATTYGTPS